ncbi:MAG: hypothetical protein ACR2NY_05990 [Alphaproteobacteria bacterium]
MNQDNHVALSSDISQLVAAAQQQFQKNNYQVGLIILERIFSLQTEFDEDLCLSIIELSADNFFLLTAEKYLQKLLAQKNIKRLVRFKAYLTLSRLGQFFADEKKMVDALHQAYRLCDKNHQAELAMYHRRSYHVALHRIKKSASADTIKQSFANLEWRKNLNWQTSFVEHDYHKTIPLWDGNPLHPDQTLLVSFEQGFGDAIQFCRFIKIIYPRATRILFEVRSEMLNLFASQFNTDWSNEDDNKKNEADILVFPYGCYDQAINMPRVKHLKLKATARVFLLSLPYLLGVDKPNHQPYFSFEKLFGKHIAPPKPTSSKKIGLVWSCGTDSHAQDRSIDLKNFLPLLSLPQYQFFSLQMPPQNQDIAAYGFSALITDLSPHIKNFDDTAKIIYQLDAMVSIDTAIAHLVASFGKKIFLLLPFTSDWRWAGIPSGEPSFWYDKNFFPFHYPTFHHSKIMTRWYEVIKNMTKTLQHEVV